MADPNITPKERAHMIEMYRVGRYKKSTLEHFLGPFTEIKELKSDKSDHVKNVLDALKPGGSPPKKKKKKKKGGDDNVIPPKMITGGN